MVLERVVGWSPMTGRDHPGDRDRHLHDRGRTRRGHLYRDCSDAGAAHRRDRAYVHRPDEGGRLRGAARRGPSELLPHDQARISDPDFPVDWNFLRRAHSWHLVLVHGPGDRAARALREAMKGTRRPGTIFAGFLKILPVFLLVLPGLIAYALYRDLFTFNAAGQVTNGDIAFPRWSSICCRTDWWG